MGERASASRRALSIVVPTRDRPEMLTRCVESLATAVGADDEIIVVDSASRDAPRIAAAAAAATKVLRCDHPGVNRARNAGWHAASHLLIAYVDDDVIVDAGWADGFARAAVAHPESAFFTGRIAAHPSAMTAHGNVAVKDEPVAAVLDGDSRGDLGHGASLLVRTIALAAVGGWDEAMGVGARFRSSPETDLYDRLFAAGFVGRYEPSALAYHDQWRTSRELIRLDWRYGFGNGARLAKLVRVDPRRARRVGGEALWGWGLRRLGPAIAQRNKTDIGRVSARLAGTATGFSRALFAPVRNGHFVERGPSNKVS
jgi:glycosyltransferase involved in cell wall biosynthesis